MCGIAGIIYKNRSHAVERERLDAMTDILAHRGPDGRGTKILGNIGLGHRRLAIIDVDAGHQPMEYADGTLTITYNGEIYNYVELRSELLQKGYRFRTHTDTEVLLALYECYGEQMFAHLNGMFAFAIHDIRRDRVLLSRDRFGEKPLYYYEDKEKILFASEIKSILTYPGIPREVNRQALHEYLTFQYCLSNRTLFKGIYKMLPSHYAVISGGGDIQCLSEYWHLGFEEDYSRNEEYYVDELRFLIEDAVKIRLRSDVPVGAYVSGGIDSSVVATIGSKLVGRGLPSFTGYFAEGPEYSELGYAEAVVRQNQSPHFTVCPTAEDFAASMEKISWYMDEPAAGPGAFPQYMVSKLASEHVKVVLGGQGGDEMFGGYARYLIVYLEEAIRGSIFGTQDSKKHIVTLDRVLPNLSMLQQYVPMLKQFWSRGLFDPVEERYFKLVSRNLNLSSYYTPEFLEDRNESEIFESFKQQFNYILTKVSSGGSSLFNRMTAYDLQMFIQSLLHVEDRMSMACSIESRLPLLDHRLAELMFRMPPLYKFRNGKPKAVLLQAVKNLLPEQILSRQNKMGFPTPVNEWAQGSLRYYFSDCLVGDKAHTRGIYCVKSLDRILASNGPFGRELWGVFSLEKWLDQNKISVSLI